MAPETRIGIGYDVHRVEEGRKLMLGCVHFADSDVGLEGHSDADVVAHAICDALLGAAGLGDIGQHFPPSDAKWKDHPGSGFLQAVGHMLRHAGYHIVNIDCTVLADVVRLGERKHEMAVTISSHLAIDPSRVNVKATTCEGRGAVGRGEVIACEAVASLQTP